MKQTLTLHMMGTVITVTIYHHDPKPILNLIKQRFIKYNLRFSANDHTSELMQINLNAGIKPIKVEPQLFDLIKLGKAASLAHDGLNIAIGPVVKLWHIGFADATVPEPDQIKARLSLTDPNLIQLNEVSHKVFLASKGMEIDLGALAKGYIADLIAKELKQLGVDSALINLGGNVLTFGDMPEHQDGLWRIGIQNPNAKRGQLRAMTKVKNQSVVTSGIYERKLTIHGKTYTHIFDPKTGLPISSDIASLTVISDRSVIGEMWTSRLITYPVPTIIDRLEQISNVSGIVIETDGRLFKTPDLTLTEF